MDAPVLRGGRRAGGFAQLAIPIQFAALVDAIAADYPAKAAGFREIADLPSQRAMLLSFSNVVYCSSAQREVELWRVRLAVYLPTGIDQRLMKGDFRRTQLLGDGPAVEAKAEQWQARLRAAGWS